MKTLYTLHFKKLIFIPLLLLFINSFSFAQCFTKVEVSNTHTLAIKTDGTLWAWGSNFYGELGDGTTVDNRNIPTQIGSSKNWSQISAGDNYYSLGLKTDGTLWAWGHNDRGQLGDGTTINKNIPTQIGTDNNWSQITTGDSYTIATKVDGSLWAWGNNNYSLGNGLTQSSSLPIQVSTVLNWIQVAVSQKNTFGLRGDVYQSYGLLSTWGNNNKGQLGDGTTTDRTTPYNVGGINPSTNWVKFKTSGLHTIAINTSSKLWAWGDNLYGQLGDGTKTDSKTPIQIGTDNWSKIAAANSRTYGIKANGTLWAWGRNNFSGFYLLGVGMPSGGYSYDYSTPIQIGTDNNWLEISSKGNHTVALKTDGSLWAWGDNLYGQLGDGTATTRSSPVLISCPTTLTTDTFYNELLNVKVYPNPTENILNIDSKELLLQKVELYDIQGRLIISEIAKSDKHIINISHLVPGTYLIKLFTDKGIKTFKTVKN